MFSWQFTKRLIVSPLLVLFLLSAAGCVPASESDLAATAPPVEATSFVETEFEEDDVVATIVPPQNNFTRIDLPNDLRPRGISDTWYVASEMAGGALYLIDIASGERTTISENGGWGNAVVTEDGGLDWR